MQVIQKLSVFDEAWPLERPFAISRGVKTEAHVVVAEIHTDQAKGRGECVPYARYDETVHGVIEQITMQSDLIKTGVDNFKLAQQMPAGAARNALDAALWDLRAKITGQRVWDLLEIPEPLPCVTATTIGLASTETMAARAQELSSAPLIKVKLDSEEVVSRMEAIRSGAPTSRLIVDPNEGWSIDDLVSFAPELKHLGVEMIEQPISAKNDSALSSFESPIPICADEACHTISDLGELAGKYQMVNIKLDKTGGLTEALALARTAKNNGLQIMVGCMVATSLAMAPGTLLGHFSEFLDLDGPLLLAKDREKGLIFENGLIHPPSSSLWG